MAPLVSAGWIVLCVESLSVSDNEDTSLSQKVLLWYAEEWVFHQGSIFLWNDDSLGTEICVRCNPEIRGSGKNEWQLTLGFKTG